MAALVLTKQSAAHRLLLAAIAMFERGDDDLATFVVASAAYSILRELVKAKGGSFQADILRAALFADAKRKTLGMATLLPPAPGFDEVIEDIADAIRSGQVEQEEDVNLVLSKEDERKLIQHQTDPFNFLKHADRDPSESLQAEDVKPLEAIVGAVAAYSRLFPIDTLPDEVEVFLRKHGALDQKFATP